MVVAHVHYAACRRAEKVAQISPKLGLILGRHVRIPLGVLEEHIPGFRILEILLMRKRGHNAARNVAKDLRLAPDRFARQATTDVAVNRIGNVRAGTVRYETHTRYVDLGFSQIGCGISRGVTQLGSHDELRQLFPDMRLLMNVVHLGGKGGRPHDDVADRGLAA